MVNAMNSTMHHSTFQAWQSKHSLLLAAALVLFLVAPTTGAATYYVDAVNGNDAWAGTQSSAGANNGPWKTTGEPGGVNSRPLQAGDQILFRRGQTWTQQLKIPNPGASGNPIIFGAYGNGAKPVIDVQGKVENAFVSYHSYIAVRDMVFKNSSSTAVVFADTGGTFGITLINVDVLFDSATITQDGANGIAFGNGGGDIYLSTVKVTNASNNGILFQGSPADKIGNVVVVNSTVSGTRLNDCFTIHEDASGNTAGSNFIFRDNYAEKCAEQAYDISTGNNVWLTGNVSRNSGEGSVLVGMSAENVKIEAHESYDEPTESVSAAINIKSQNVQLVSSIISGSGYRLLNISDGTRFGAKNIEIVNNTFVSNNATSIFDLSGLSENIKVLNNIFTTDLADRPTSQMVIRFYEQSRPPDYPGFMFDHNVYYFPGGGQEFLRTLVNKTTYVNFDFSEFNEFGHEISGSTLDPMLIARTAGNYKLSADSAAIDGGQVYTGLAVDHDGVPHVGNPDIGAYEFQP